MNLCPCGARGDPGAACVCTPQRVERYRERLSRALLDRFDLVLAVPRPRGEELAAERAEPSADVRLRVLLAREHLAVHDVPLGDAAAALLTTAVERVSLSARARARSAPWRARSLRSRELRRSGPSSSPRRSPTGHRRS